MGYEQEFI